MSLFIDFINTRSLVVFPQKCQALGLPVVAEMLASWDSESFNCSSCPFQPHRGSAGQEEEKAGDYRAAVTAVG